MKSEFVYFFNSSVVLDSIGAWRENSGICGSSIGPTLLVPCCVKPISVDVITGKRPDPIVTAIGNLCQLDIHRRIGSALQVQTGRFVILIVCTRMYEEMKLYLLFGPRNEIGHSISRTLFEKSLSFVRVRLP